MGLHGGAERHALKVVEIHWVIRHQQEARNHFALNGTVVNPLNVLELVSQTLGYDSEWRSWAPRGFDRIRQGYTLLQGCWAKESGLSC